MMEIARNVSYLDTAAINPDLFERFCAYIDAAPKTVETYRRALRQFALYMQNNGISHPTRETVLAFKAAYAVDHKPSTINGYLSALRVFFEWAEGEGIYPNVTKRVKNAKVGSDFKKDALTAAQAKAVLSSIDQNAPHGLRDYALMVLLLTCGLRTCEVSRADVGDLRPVGGSCALFVQGKGHDSKDEFVKLPMATEFALRRYLASRADVSDASPLFCSESNNNGLGRLTERSLSRIARMIFDAAGFCSERITAHSCRHTAITLALQAGKTLEETAQFARHTSIATTLIYAHHLEKSQNSCSAAVADALF